LVVPAATAAAAVAAAVAAAAAAAASQVQCGKCCHCVCIYTGRTLARLPHPSSCWKRVLAQKQYLVVHTAMLAPPLWLGCVCSPD
jgi:hypothetical protein